jgi:hypothetical protein
MTEILEKATLPQEQVRRRLRMFAAPVIDKESANAC